MQPVVWPFCMLSLENAAQNRALRVSASEKAFFCAFSGRKRIRLLKQIKCLNDQALTTAIPQQQTGNRRNTAKGCFRPLRPYLPLSTDGVLFRHQISWHCSFQQAVPAGADRMPVQRIILRCRAKSNSTPAFSYSGIEFSSCAPRRKAGRGVFSPRPAMIKFAAFFCIIPP